MLTMLKNWNGPVEINGMSYEDMKHAILDFKPTSGQIHIVLQPKQLKRQNADGNAVKQADTKQEYQLTVKKYMTQPASPEFDFMSKWNNNKPMPMRMMQGTVEKETRGMVYMKLHGMAKPTVTCFCCGKELTNPISRKYGIGPICLSKMGIVRDIEDVKGISEELVNLTWEGWIIRSAITEWEEVK